MEIDNFQIRMFYFIQWAHFFRIKVVFDINFFLFHTVPKMEIINFVICSFILVAYSPNDLCSSNYYDRY